MNISKICVFPCLFFLFFSCKNNSSTNQLNVGDEQELEINNSNVEGKWKAEKFISTIPDIPQNVVEAGEKEFLSSVYTLNADNSMEMSSNYFINGAKGRWELNGETKEISMFYEYDTIKGVEKYIITSLSDLHIVLKQEMGSDKSFVELTLKK